MSALDEIKKNLGASSVKPLDSDINRKGTTQPVTQPKTTGSAVDAIRANLNSPTPAVPVTKPTAESKGIFSSIKGGYDAYANQVERKAMSFNAGFVASVGQLARSFQWLGDRIVGDRIVQKASDKLLESELKHQDTLLKLYRERRDSGDTVGAERAMKLLKEASNNMIPYEAYADTTDSVFYKAQDKTQAWADVLKKSAGITPENSKFSDRLFEGAGSSATYFIPSLGVFKGASVLAKVSPRIAMLFAGSAGASLEAMAEAGSTFDEVKKTKGLQEAGEESTKVFLANAILLAVSNNLGIFNPDKLGLLKRALLSAPIEGLQEGVQQAIQNEATGRPIWDGVLEAGAIGAIVGSVMGGVTDAVTTQTVEKNEGGKSSKKATTSESPAITALRERLNVTPALEAQKAIEQGSSTPLPSPTGTQGQNQGTEAVPVGQGSGLEADVRLPEVVAQQKEVAFKDFEKLASRVTTLEDLKKAIDNADIANLDDVVQFHGTQNANFVEALRNGTLRVSEDGVIGRGFYVTNTPETADYFGRQVKDGNARSVNGVTPEVHAIDLRDLNIKKLPFGKQEYYDFLEEQKMSANEYNAKLSKEGYDGLNLEGRGETVIFNSTKVKELKLDPLIKQPKTQKELVKEAVAEKPKTIKQIAEELGIKEPNVRRILGQGAKSGTFERVDKGVYILNNGTEDIAFVHTADAIETLPKLAKEGLKADMVFLDIPYDTPAVKGGNRGVQYNLISPEQFRTVMKAVSDIVRTEETPVYYMFSQAESGMKAMMKYNEILDETGFKAVAKGNWQKMFNNGKKVTNVRGVVAKPEGILLLNKKGEFVEKDSARNLDFETRRPQGYSTEKPVELLNSLILQGTKEGDTILDPFAGSGVAGAEAVKAGRKAVLIEKNEEVSKNITQPRVKKALEDSRSKTIGLVDTGEGYTPRMKELIAEAQKNGDTFPYTKMTKEEQAIVDDQFRKILNEAPVNIPEGFKPYEATITTDTVDVKKLSDPAYFVEVYESTFAVGGDKGLYAIMTKALVPKGREASGFLADAYKKAKGEIQKATPEKKTVGQKQDLRLEAQPETKPEESRTQTEVAGKKVNRFTGLPQEEKNPRVIGQQKPNISKAKLKTLLDNTPEFKANPILTIEETSDGKVFSWSSEKSSFSIKPQALGLVTENLQVGDQVRVSPETFKNTGQELRVIKYDDKTGAGSKYASVGRYRDDTEVFLGNPDAIKPIQFPELVGLAKELSGNTPFLRKYQKSNGMFYGKGTGEIGLNPELFKRENLGQLTKTLAHEIGHLIDYLPDQTLARGNLMGRLNTLKNFRKDFFAPAGASRTDTELRTQMYELSKYWRPYDEATASASFIQYRKSAPEIYADFISALFNDPRTVSSIAPTAYNVFFQQLDNKPNVKQAYFELQDLLRNGDVVANRRSATSEMFKVTEQESRERQIQNQIEQEMKEKSVWFKFKTEFVDLTEVVKQDVKRAEKEGKYINPDDNPTYYLEERNYIGGKIKSEVETKFNTIYQELQKDGLAWEDLGELMFYERILKGDRQEIANPLGYQPDFVQELMEVYEDVGSVKPDQKAHEQGTSDMKAVLGEDKFRKLQALAVEYRQNLKSFFEQGREEGIYSEELAQLFEENAFYVPFKGAKYSGVTKTTFGVKQQKGTLGNIENPANTGIEKAVSIIRAIERNRVTRKTIEFYQENFPEEVTVAPTDKSGQPLNPREEDLDLVTYMQDGKVKGFHVDKYIAEAIKKNTSGKQNQLIRGIRFFNSGLFRPLFITFNLGFQSFNAIRDFKRFWKNVPNMTILKAMKLYGQSARAGKIRAFGLPKNPSAKDIEANEFINRLENEKVISVTYNDIIKGENIEDAQIDRILRETGVRETKDTKLGLLGERIGVTKNTPIIKQAFQILDFIEKTGNMIETIPKVAGVKAIEGTMSPIEMRSFVRKYVGSPDFLAGGRDKKAVNEIFLFANAIAQGIRSDYEIATQPKSRGAYWLKTVQSELLPKLLMLMATAGLFGEALKELFGKVSEYDKANYTIIPLGEDENGKAIYFRMPSDESGRLIGGVFWKLATALSDTEKLAELNTYTDLISYAGGQVPSVSPVVELGAFTLPTFLAGNNPYDFFRGRQVLTDEQQLAGGTERLKPFLSYMFQQLGGNVFMKLYYNETVPKNPSLSEKIVNLPVLSNIAGRFIKTSNYGEVEKVREVSSEIRSEKAREGIANRRVVFDYVDQSQGKSYGEVQALKKQMIQDIYGGFPKTPEDRTQARNLEKRFDTLRLRGTADAKLDALLTAQSNDEKVALLREYQKTMTPNEYDDLKRFIIKNRVVSSAVFQTLNRVDK